MSAIGTSRLTERQRELLRVIRVKDNVAVFASDERIPDWAALKKVMVALGGSWRTRKGFVFADDVDAAEAVRLAIESGEILDPKEAGFFPTPRALADHVVELADVRPGDVVLEPSAGRGALALAVRRACPEAIVRCVEALPDHRRALTAEGFEVVGENFLTLDPKGMGRHLHGQHSDRAGQFGWNDVVIMNPPFGGQADIDHVTRAFTMFTKPNGGLVAIMAAGVLYRTNAKTRAFRQMVESAEGYFEENPPDAFRESGTGVRTVTLVIPRGEG